jgi:hypothetical protein
LPLFFAWYRTFAVLLAGHASSILLAPARFHLSPIGTNPPVGIESPETFVEFVFGVPA